MKIARLEIKHLAGHGTEIYGIVDKEVPCGLRFPELLPYLLSSKSTRGEVLVGYAPWRQFPLEEWDTMIEEIYQQMVDLWNKHYGQEQL